MTLFVQAAASAAVIAPAVAAPRLVERLQLGPAAVGLFVALVYLAAMFASPLGAHLVRRLGPIRSSQAALPLSHALDHDREPQHPWPTLRQLMAPVVFVARHAALRPMALCSLVFSIVQVSLVAYMVSYLTADLRWTLAAAGAALSASQVAGVAGRIVWGLVSDRWLGPRRMLLLLALAMLGCGLAMPALHAGSPAGLVVALLCVYGATAVGWNGVYLATVARLVPHAQAAMATAGTLFFTFFGVVVGPPLFGAAGSAFGALGPAFALLALPLAGGLLLLWRARWS